MKTYYRQILMTGLFIFTIIFSSLGQEKTIRGLVTTFDSIPIVDASVFVKSSKQEYKTDSLGRFTVKCQPSDKLKITANGFYDQKVRIKPKIKLALINLHLMARQGTREYAVGYGHVNEKEKLNAMSSLNNKDVNFSQYSDIYDLIRGRFAGVQIINGDIVIRGQSSFYGSSAALIVIDDIVSNKEALKAISPTDVKNISILKDASAAIYGTRGATGVVFVELKKGGE